MKMKEKKNKIINLLNKNGWLKFLFLFGLYIFVPSLFYSVLVLFNFTDNDMLLQVLANFLYVLIIVVIFRKQIIFLFKDYRDNFSEHFSCGIKCWGIGFTIMIVSNLIINVFLSGGQIASNEEANRAILLANPFLGMISAVILAPIVEEFTFRYALKSTFKKMIPFALTSAVIFGGLHLISSIGSWEWWTILYIIPYGSLGFMFAISYYKTKNLLVPISMHLLHNGIVYALLLIYL